MGDPETFALPPYLASLVVVDSFPAPEDGNDVGRISNPSVPVGRVSNPSYRTGSREVNWLRRIFELLRPYGGAACLPLAPARLEALAARAELPAARIKPVSAGRALLIREGPLPGAADWTHQYADPANTVVSQDDRVRTPLGLLWFGGPSNDEILPRHGHGPAPQVAGGRLVIEGRNMLRALDVYTGRLLWQTSLPDLGAFYDNTSHQPGANEIGSNYVALPDAVYVLCGKRILKLDAANGKPAADFEIGGHDQPAVGARPSAGANPPPDWGFLAVSDDLLVTTSAPLGFARSKAAEKSTGVAAAVVAKLLANRLDFTLPPTRYGPASRRLAVFDRHSGKPLWDRPARFGFRHNTIVVGGGRLFVIDGLSPAQQDAMKRRGLDFKDYAAAALGPGRTLRPRGLEHGRRRIRDVLGVLRRARRLVAGRKCRPRPRAGRGQPENGRLSRRRRPRALEEPQAPVQRAVHDPRRHDHHPGAALTGS